MPTFSINPDLAVFLDAALGFSFFPTNILIDLFEAREVGTTQSLGQPA